MFSAKSLGVVARKATRRAGLATIGYWEPMHDKPQWYIANDPLEMDDTVCFVAYSPSKAKSVNVLWADMWFIEQYADQAKPARVG